MNILIKRDGVEVAAVDDQNAAFAWLLRHTNQSVAYAVKYDGYTVVAADDPEQKNLFADYAKGYHVP